MNRYNTNKMTKKKVGRATMRGRPDPIDVEISCLKGTPFMRYIVNGKPINGHITIQFSVSKEKLTLTGDVKYGKFIDTVKALSGNIKHGMIDYEYGTGEIESVKPKWTYTGGVRFLRRHGFGRCTYEKGVYIGYWKNNLEHGDGELQAPDGFIYTGTWVNGVLTGPVTVKIPLYSYTLTHVDSTHTLDDSSSTDRHKRKRDGMTENEHEDGAPLAKYLRTDEWSISL